MMSPDDRTSFVGQEDKDDPDEFMGSRKNGLLEGQAVLDGFVVFV